MKNSCLIVVLTLLVSEGCDTCNVGKQVTLLDHDFVLYNGSTFENTLKVITPGSDVPKGAIALINGQNPGRPGVLVYRPLLDSNNNYNINGASTVTSFSTFTSIDEIATDNNIIHQKGNTLFMIKNGYTWSKISPHPFWWDWISAHSTYPSGARNAIYIFKSSDGLNWSNTSLIDAAKIGNGDYGVPQTAKNTIGGFDRTEVYQDPWTERFFVTGHGDGGPMTEDITELLSINHDRHNDVIMTSKDGDSNWSIIKEINQGAPMQMTSTPNGRFFAFSASGGTPMIYYNKDKNDINTINDGFPAFYIESGTNITATIDENAPSSIKRDIQQTSICRVSTDKQTSIVCLAYSTTNKNGRQEYRLVTVKVDDDHSGQSPVVSDLYALKPEDEKNNSILYGSFIQPDYVGSSDYTDCGNPILFYYIETGTGSNPKSRTKYLLFLNSGFASNSMVLYSTGYLSTNNVGSPRLFNTTSLGDYMTGGFFEYKHNCNFMAQWPEGDGVHANIVSVSKDSDN